MTAVGLVIPSCGAPCLAHCLDAVARLTPRPVETIVVLSGPGCDRPLPGAVTAVRSDRTLGFAAAVNAGLARLTDAVEHVALLNDDAMPGESWLAPLGAELEREPGVAAVQSTVVDARGDTVDGCGIVFDLWGLPVQLDRGLPVAGLPDHSRRLVAVSATAALLRRSALEQVRLPGGVLDPAFASYHEDLDLGLRLLRLGWGARWVPGTPTRHLGSVTGSRRRWVHPWWVLANRWRALAGNLEVGSLLVTLPRLLRGEARALRTLTRSNPRALVVGPVAMAVLPALLLGGWLRATPGPRLAALPEADR